MFTPWGYSLLKMRFSAAVILAEDNIKNKPSNGGAYDTAR
jgi:hypothetical protein